MRSFARFLLLLPLALATVKAEHWQYVRDSREHMFLAPGTKRSAPYLGKRDASKNGLPYPENVATAPTQVPDAWLAKYKEVKAAGLIADIPVATATADGNVEYPSGFDPASKDVCNWEVTQCFMDDTINTAPDGVLAIGLDDGPTEAVGMYADFYKQENISVSHFLIGRQILTCPSCMQTLVNMVPEQHLGIHSFTHTQIPLMKDEDVVADIGWSLQIVYDYSGKIPLYFRPPQGDIDRRVMTIVREVFGVQTVMWSQDLLDWCLQDKDSKETVPDICKGTTLASVRKGYTSLMDANPKRGVLLLGHEIRNASLAPFATLIAEAKKKNWKIGPTTDMSVQLPWYQNAVGPNIKAEAVDDILPKRKPFTVTNGGNTITLTGDWTGGGSSSSSGSSGSGDGSSDGSSTGSTGNTTAASGTSLAQTNGTVNGTTATSGDISSFATPAAALLGTVTGLLVAALVIMQ